MEIDDKQVEETVKQWYTKTAKSEWYRLQHNAYGQIEFMITMRFLNEYLPKTGLLLDAGGGPGRYTVELAKQRYDIILLDLVPEMLKLARVQIRRAGVENKVKQIVQGSVEDLSMFEDQKFDAVLCLGGPIGHMLKPEQRKKAASELVRVAKKKAPIFVSVISRIGLLKTMLARFQNEMKYAKHHLEVGDYIPGQQGDGFTAAHWFLPEELRGLFEKQGAKTLEMVGLEGLSSHLPRETNRLYKDKEKWRTWTDILLKTCTHPSVVGSSEHFLLICRKNG